METAYLPKYTFKGSPFLYLLIPLIAGILAYPYLSKLIRFQVLWMLLILLLASSAHLLFRKTPTFINLISVSVGLSFFLLGLCLSYHRDVQHDPRWFGNYLSETEALIGKVAEPALETNKTIKLIIKVEQFYNEGRFHPVRGKVLLYLYRSEDLPQFELGDRIYFPNQLEKIKNRGNPHEFDYAAYLYRRDLHYQAFLPIDAISYEPPKRYVISPIQTLRQNLLRVVRANIKDTAAAALTEATLLNNRSLLSKDIQKAYSVTGIAHIIAISGMHVSLFFTILLLLLSWIKTPRFNWIKYLAALPVIWLYVSLTDFPPSAVRAAIMFSLLFLALAFNRNYSPLNCLAFTAFLMLCIDPLWLYDTGVQLSFMAVASIFIFLPAINLWWQPRHKLLKALWGILSLSLSVQFLVFPIVLYYFHQFPLWFLLANVPAAVFSFLLMCGGLLLFLLHGLGLPCLWLGDALGLMTSGFHKIIFFFARHTPERFLYLPLSQKAMWLLLISSFFLGLWLCYHRKFALLATLGFSALHTLILITEQLSPYQQDRIIVYNNSKESVIDYFHQGQSYSLGLADSALNTNTFQYLLLPARLGYRQKYRALVIDRAEWLINQESLIILKQGLQPGGPSYGKRCILILSNTCPWQPQLWEEIFAPKQFILDSSFPRWKAQKWAKDLSAIGFSVHNVQEEGAWIFPHP